VSISNKRRGVWLACSIVGNTKTLKRLKHRYGEEFTSLNVPQLIGCISFTMKVPEPAAEEIACLGPRMLFNKLTMTDAVFPRSDFHTNKTVHGKLKRVTLPHGRVRQMGRVFPTPRDILQKASMVLPETVHGLANPRMLHMSVTRAKQKCTILKSAALVKKGVQPRSGYCMR
jgi:hypothetical protein